MQPVAKKWEVHNFNSYIFDLKRFQVDRTKTPVISSIYKTKYIQRNARTHGQKSKTSKTPNLLKTHLNVFFFRQNFVPLPMGGRQK